MQDTAIGTPASYKTYGTLRPKMKVRSWKEFSFAAAIKRNDVMTEIRRGITEFALEQFPDKETPTVHFRYENKRHETLIHLPSNGSIWLLRQWDFWRAGTKTEDVE